MEGGAARKAFDLALGDLGPYSLAFTRSGRFAALAGRRGHLALLDWLRLSIVCELQVQPCCIRPPNAVQLMPSVGGLHVSNHSQINIFCPSQP